MTFWTVEEFGPLSELLHWLRCRWTSWVVVGPVFGRLDYLRSYRPFEQMLSQNIGGVVESLIHGHLKSGAKLLDPLYGDIIDQWSRRWIPSGDVGSLDLSCRTIWGDLNRVFEMRNCLTTWGVVVSLMEMLNHLGSIKKIWTDRFRSCWSTWGVV